MRIIVVHQDLYRQGGQLVAARIATGLAAAGHHVDLAVSKIHDDFKRTHPGLKPFPIPESVNVHVLPSRRALFNIWALARLFHRLKPDIIMPHVGHYFIAATLARNLLCSSAKVVYVEHNAVLGSAKGAARMGLWWLTRYCMKCAAKVIAVSEGVRQGLIRHYNLAQTRVVTIYNPVLDQAFDETLKQPPTHPWLVTKTGFTIVAAGALCHRKGFEYLVTAFKEVHSVEPCSRLIIYGDGPEFAPLNDLICRLNLMSAVSLAGFTDRVGSNFKAADLFVLSSRKEAFGLVLVEALAAGLPVVATECPVGPREILKEGELGQLVPVDDLAAMRDAIIRVIRGEKGKPASFDSSLYRLDYVVARYERVLERVLTENDR